MRGQGVKFKNANQYKYQTLNHSNAYGVEKVRNLPCFVTGAGGMAFGRGLMISRQSWAELWGDVRRHPMSLPLTTGVAKEDPSYPALLNGTLNLQQFGDPGLVTTPIVTNWLE